MGTLARYARLMGYFIRFSMSRSMEFRMDFFFRIFMDVFYYAVNIAFFRVVFLHTPSLGGWDEPQTMVFVSAFLLVDAIHMTLFTNNQWQLPIFVNRGDLDYYLIRPVSSLFFLSLRDFAFNSLFNVLIASGILAWALVGYEAAYPGAVTAGKLGLFLCALSMGVLLSHTFAMLAVIPVFWTHSVNGFRQVYWSLARFSERPDGIFRGWARRVLTIVLPFSLVASFPSRLFLEAFSWGTLGHLIGVSLAFFGVLGLAWRAGLRAYSSASS